MFYQPQHIHRPPRMPWQFWPVLTFILAFNAVGIGSALLAR